MTDKNSRATTPVSRNTLYIDRVIEALTLLCAGKRPERDIVIGWEDDTSEELQTWAVCNAAAPWATGIGVIEAAQALANTPEEGLNHQDREDAFPSTRTAPAPTPASELVDRIELAVGDDDSWNLALAKGGHGSLSTSDGITYFNSASQLDDALNELIAK